jgi:hypothetical protein
VMKNVETDQACVKIAILTAVIDIAFLYRHSIARFSVYNTCVRCQWPAGPGTWDDGAIGLRWSALLNELGVAESKNGERLAISILGG